MLVSVFTNEDPKSHTIILQALMNPEHKFCSEEVFCSSKCNITAIYIKVILPWIYSDMKRIRRMQFNFAKPRNHKNALK